MTSRLWFKLMGAFVLVIIVGVVVTVVLTRQGAATQLSHYMIGDQMVRPQDLQSAFAAYYKQHDGWDGVDAALDRAISTASPGGMMGGMMAGIMGVFNSRIRIVDINGTVVADSAGPPGASLGLSLSAQTWPVTVDDIEVGSLVFDGSSMTMPTSQSSEILSSVTRSVLYAALVAAVVALVLAGVLIRQITRPLGQLNRASHQVAAGDLTARVPVKGSDEIAELAATFNQMATSLQSQELLRRQMVADIAHELRTPLAGIQGTVEALQDGVFEMSPDNLEPVHEQVMLLNRLVADLRTLSLVEAGNLALQRGPVDLSELVKKHIERFRAQALAQDVELRLESHNPDSTVLGDEHRLGQVIGNLLDNALRHTPQGGAVTVELDTLGNKVRLAVIDTGEGIPSEDLERVFDRFYRPDSARSRQSGGSGLGLAIARRIVDAHGGYIWVESPPSEKGHGSAFYLTIPLYQPQSSSA